MWLVEWDEPPHPRNEFGDLEVDAIQYQTRIFPTREKAEPFAETKASGSAFGVATLVEVRKVTARQVREDDEMVARTEGGQWWAEVGSSEEVHASGREKGA